MEKKDKKGKSVEGKVSEEENRYGRPIKIFSYRDLQVWQKSHRLAVEVYRCTKKFPKDHRYELTSQLNRAALSVPTNIAEGHPAHHTREYSQFLNIAARSVSEVRYLIFFASEIDLLNREESNVLDQEYGAVERMLNALMRSLKKHFNGGV